MTSGNARQVEGRETRAGSSRTMTSSSSRVASKRQKVDHSEDNGSSKYWPRGAQVNPFTPVSSRPALAIDDAIIIDGEDDTPATKDDPHEPIVLKTSSPDPMDIIGPLPYAFDQNKPSPMNQLSSLVGDKPKLPQDGPSTLRLRRQYEARESESASRPDGGSDDVSTSGSTARAEAPAGRSNVSSKVAIYEDKLDGVPHFNVLPRVGQPRKDSMKPKQVGLLYPICCTCLQLSGL